VASRSPTTAAEATIAARPSSIGRLRLTSSITAAAAAASWCATIATSRRLRPRYRGRLRPSAIAGGYDHGYRGGYGGRVVVANSGPRYYGGYSRSRSTCRAPVIRERYYQLLPAARRCVVENYGPREGYFWIGGAWSWDWRRVDLGARPLRARRGLRNDTY